MIPTLRTKVLPAVDNVTETDCAAFGDFLLDSTGPSLITLTPPTWNTKGQMIEFTNPAPLWAAVECVGGLPRSRDGFFLAPGETVSLLGKCDDLGNSYWGVRDRRFDGPQFTDYVPTPTWGTANPTITSNTAAFEIEDGICHFEGAIVCSDGKNASSLVLTPPEGIIPVKTDVKIPIHATAVVDGTPTNALGYVDCVDGTGENRGVVGFLAFPAFTTGKACSIRYSGWFEVDGTLNTWTSTIAQTGGPSTLTTVSRYRRSRNYCYFVQYHTSADGKDATAVTATLPIPIKDWNAKLDLACFEKVDATYYNPKGYIDAVTNTVADRLIKFDTLTQLANGKAIVLAVAGRYPIANEITFTPDITWASAALTPGTLTSVGRMCINGNRMEGFIYLSSADGNAATAPTIQLPLPPRKISRVLGLQALQLVNTTWYDCAAYVARGMTDPEERLITFQNWTTATNAQAFALRLDFSVEIAN